MNRFDTSTIWNCDAKDLDDEKDSESSPPSDASVHGSAESAAPSGEHWNASSETPSSWSAALATQTYFLPLHYEPNYRYPLIVWLHSDGFNENQVCHVMPHVSARNYVATGIRASTATDSSGHRFAWSMSESSFRSAQQTVLEAIDRVASQYSVHAERIILAGYAEGGSMAARIALRHPEMFSAVVSLGGRFDLEGLSASDRERVRSRRLPMLWQHSLQSPRYSQDRLVAEVGAATTVGARVEIRQYRNDDEMNTVVLRDLDRWIMSHVVSGSPVAKMNQWDSSPTSFSDN